MFRVQVDGKKVVFWVLGSFGSHDTKKRQKERRCKMRSKRERKYSALKVEHCRVQPVQIQT